MSLIHISTQDGQSTVYDEAQVRTMLQQGILSPRMLYWKEGMSQWEPLQSLGASEVQGVVPMPPAQTNQDGSGRYTFVKNPLLLTKVLKVLLWLFFGIYLTSLVHEVDGLRLFNHEEGLSLPVAEAYTARQKVIGWLHVLIALPTFITFGMWIHRANRNARGFGAQKMKFTPGWAVGWYFVPILNLIRPYEAMKEIWQVSTDPSDWQKVKGSSLLGWWWALWILFNVSSNISSRVNEKAETMEALISSTQISVGFSGVALLLTLVAQKLVSSILEKQKALTQSAP